MKKLETNISILVQREDNQKDNKTILFYIYTKVKEFRLLYYLYQACWRIFALGNVCSLAQDLNSNFRVHFLRVIHIYIYIYRERERERDGGKREGEGEILKIWEVGKSTSLSFPPSPL